MAEPRFVVALGDGSLLHGRDEANGIACCGAEVGPAWAAEGGTARPA